MLQVVGFQAFGNRRESADVGEQHGHLATVAFHGEPRRIAAHLLDEFRRHVLTEATFDLVLRPGLREIAVGHVHRVDGKDEQQPRCQRQDEISVVPDRQVQSGDREQGDTGGNRRPEGREERQADRQEESGQRQQHDLRAEHVRWPLLDRAVEDAGQQVRVDLDPGEQRCHGRRPEILQAGRGGADENDAVLQGLDRRAIPDDVGRGHVGEASLRPAIGNERRGLFVDRNADGRGLHPFESGIPLRQYAVGRIPGDDLRRVQEQPDDRERERLVVRTVVAGKHRHPTVHAIRIGGRREVAGPRRRGLKLGQVAAVALECREPDVASGEGAGRQDGRRQRTDREALAADGLIREVVAEDNRPAPKSLGEEAIELEARCDRGERGAELRVALQLVVAEILQDLETGAIVPLREDHVEADDRGTVTIRQLLDQERDAVAPPGPSALFREALLVDVDDHDPRIERRGHRQLEPRVVHDGFERVNEAQVDDARGLRNEQENQQNAEEDPGRLLLQDATSGGMASLPRCTR